MDDLVAWLTAIWDEEGRLAKRAGDALTTPEIDNYGHLTVPSAWMLARIAADRQILALHSFRMVASYDSHIKPIPGSERPRCLTCASQDENGEDWPCDTARALALPYADRPGYQEAWKP